MSSQICGTSDTCSSVASGCQFSAQICSLSKATDLAPITPTAWKPSVRLSMRMSCASLSSRSIIRITSQHNYQASACAAVNELVDVYRSLVFATCGFAILFWKLQCCMDTSAGLVRVSKNLGARRWSMCAASAHLRRRATLVPSTAQLAGMPPNAPSGLPNSRTTVLTSQLWLCAILPIKEP